jgi:hypothetical protein
VWQESDQFNFVRYELPFDFIIDIQKIIVAKSSHDVFFESFSSHGWRIIRTK